MDGKPMTLRAHRRRVLFKPMRISALILSINVSGAVVSYFLVHRSDKEMKLALGLPLIMSIAFVVIFSFGGRANLVTRKEIRKVVEALGLTVWPELLFLTIILWPLRS